MWVAQNMYRSSYRIQPLIKQLGPDHHALDLSTDLGSISFDTDALRETHRVIGIYLAGFPEEQEAARPFDLGAELERQA